ncbi:MAG: PD-(D/E)XK nuclease family transposase [Bacillota bacterium]|nr:PD-(D/E)XK nuclease family transposase [Bacillota bacterium]
MELNVTEESIEQPKDDNKLNEWIAFLINPTREGIEVSEPEIMRAMTVLDTLSRDPETVRLAELRMKKLLDEKSMLEGAKEEGKEEAALGFLSLGMSE